MSAPLDVDREAVRVLVVALGVRQAAREMGLNEDTVSAWSARYGWLKHLRAAPVVPASLVRIASNASKQPAEALADALESLSTRSRIGFAKASAKVAEKLADTEAEALVGMSAEAKSWAQTAAIAHSWSGGAGTTVQVSVGLRLDME